MPMAALEDDDEDGAVVVSTQEAELAVQRSVAVREEYKATLHALLDMVPSETSRKSREYPKAAPPNTSSKYSSVTSSIKSSAKATKAKPSKAVPTEKASPKRQLRLPRGKEMHMLGDWLLLVRAASVNVVEAIQTWRRVVHQGKPQPFLHDESGNYLLAMCEDLDFLDGSADLVEWLGFRLARNPFIVQGALDDVMSGSLGDRAVHGARSLKYWTSSSWQRRKKRRRGGGEAGCDPSQANDASASEKLKAGSSWRARAPPPPPALAKPLVSILPEDDVVDGARIGAAQQILLEEEALYGRMRALRAIRQYLVDVGSISDDDERADGDHDREEQQHKRVNTTVFDEIADQTVQIKCELLHSWLAVSE